MRIAPKITALALAALSLAGCGSRERDPRDLFRPHLSQLERSEGGKTPGNPQTSGQRPRGAQPVIDPNAPVDTLLQDGLVIPQRLNAQMLTVTFTASLQGASFDCAQGSSLVFTPCDGNTYAFGRLTHGRSYMVRVRARMPDGRLDATPLVVSFVADFLTGTAPTTVAPEAGAGAIIPESAADLPQPVPAGAPTSTEGRSLQVGSFFAVAVPADQQVISYATTKNYAARQQYYRLASTASCAGNEREVAGPEGSGTTYCESAELGGPVARNHIEMVRPSPQGLEERLLVAAFDQDRDPAEAKIGLGARCVGSNYQGQTQVPLLATYYQEVSTQLLHWCQARDEQGDWWWVGSFAAIISRNPSPARLTVVYAVNVRQGLFSGQQFATYAERRLPRLIIPIATPAGTP